MTTCPPPFCIWLYGSPAARIRAKGLVNALSGQAAPVLLGPPGEPAPDIDLGPEPDLGLALEASPDGMRPRALVILDGLRPPSADGLPCPALTWPEGQDPESFAAAVMETARQGESFPWLERVQVNLPLRGLFGSYGRLAVEWPINPEVGIDARALDTLRPKHLRFAKEMLKGRRITAHLPFLDLAPGATDPLAAEVVRKRLEKAAIWAVELGATQAVAHLSYNSRIRRDPERYLGHLVENMGPAARVLKEAGAGLALENTIEHEPTILVLARDAMAQAVGGRVGFCLDTGHALAFTNTSLEDWWRAMAPHLIEIHLHDNNGLFDDHLPPGQGKLDWDFTRKGFDQLDPKPVLTLEPHRETHFWASLRGLEQVWG